MIYGSQDAIVFIQVTLSQAYVTERYNELFSKDFQNLLLSKRKKEIDEIKRVKPDPIYSSPMIVYCDGIYEPNDDMDWPVIKFSGLGLKNLGTKTQIYTLAKTIQDLLNNGTNKYEIKAPVFQNFSGDLRKDFPLYIEEPYQSQQSSVNRTDLQDW